MKSAIARTVRATPPLRWLAGAAEYGLFGTPLRERIALGILGAHYKSLYRRHWGWWLGGEPHFTPHRIELFNLLKGNGTDTLYAFSRAFYSAEVVRPGDVVLDIGCGEGSITKRALAPKAGHVDAIDIEPSAIEAAKRLNPAPNITYRRLDAVNEPLPQTYDVIVFDGAIGHFSPEGSAKLLTKIAQSLKPGGVFCGSESLGHEGHDHLQFFDTLEDMRAMLAPHFKHVRLKEHAYGERIEGYWRASNSSERLDEIGWR